jgi:hypothetical protein
MHTEFLCKYFKEFAAFIDRKDLENNIALRCENGGTQN